MTKKQWLETWVNLNVMKIGVAVMAFILTFGGIPEIFADVPQQGFLHTKSKASKPANELLKVDFSYSFATPHRITLGRPDASDRTLMDVNPGNIRMAWSYDNLAMSNFYPLSLRIPQIAWSIQIVPQIEDKSLEKGSWSRLDQILPGFDKLYQDSLGTIRLKALSGMTAALINVELQNTDSKAHQFVIRCNSESWGEMPSWVDPSQHIGDHMVAGWNERADRILVMGIGADSYSEKADGQAPGKCNMVLIWNLQPGEKRQGWIVRPYNSYLADLPALRKHDWASEMEQGKKEWNDLLNRATRMIIPDVEVTNAYRACLADLFIMREPIANGRMIAVPGTDSYRAGNSGEPLLDAIALDQNGFHKEAKNGASVSIDMQDPDGNWADVQGWCHNSWAVVGFKSWFIMNHYRITGDKTFLAEVYPKMLASSRFQEKQRARSRNAAGEKSMTYGLMPRGFGDCGLMNDGDLYGVYIPHNIFSVYADRCTLEAAEILNKTDDIAELKKIFETAHKDLLTALDRGAINEGDYRWIPGVPGKTGGSSWGSLYAVSPCKLIDPNHKLVTGTIRRIESNISRGGQPLHNGWMDDGSWVAITLDNLAEAKLAQGNGDAAVKYLYSTLNHGTPLYTWCEERGQEPNTTKTSGDRQHLWTPVAIVRILRDMFVLEDGKGINLAVGTAREWLASGKMVG
ncbi:MAG: hypothetical protein Q8862_03920, partial [Bacteroidota bacterium]|nr:hypothetical protein [Bacteroidota bacterium]